MAPRQVSRAWLGRYALPRNKAGKFTPGYVLWTRPDGQSRFIHWPGPDDFGEHRGLSEHGRRVLTHIALVIAVVFLIWVAR